MNTIKTYIIKQVKVAMNKFKTCFKIINHSSIYEIYFKINIIEFKLTKINQFLFQKDLKIPKFDKLVLVFFNQLIFRNKLIQIKFRSLSILDKS